MLKDNLAYYRTKAGLSQADLAHMVGCSQQFIHNCEDGLRVPSLGVTASIAKACGCTIDDLVKGKQ